MNIDPTLFKVDPTSLPNDPSVPNPVMLTFGTLYLYQKAGVALPEHDHNDSNIHATVIIRGSFKITRASTGDETATAGDILNFQPNDPHSFTALEDDSLMLNVTKMGTDIASLTNQLTAFKAALAAFG